MFALNKCFRTATTGQLVEPRIQTKQGKMAFSHYAAHYWNQLPVYLRFDLTVVFTTAHNFPFFKATYLFYTVNSD